MTTTDRCANPYCGKPVTTSCDACDALLCAECALSADGGNAVACPPCALGEWEEWGVADD